MPEPIITPAAHFSSSVSGTKPESASACAAAAMPRWMKRSIFLISLGGIHSAKSSPPSAASPAGTCPAIFAANSVVSKL